MDEKFKQLKDEVFSFFGDVAKKYPAYDDVQMFVGGGDTHANLKRSLLHKSIDAEWIDVVEEAIVYLDTFIRKPGSAIEDVDEILPIEISRHITEKSVKHLAQHTYLILKVEDDMVTPQKILNVYHDETLLTYENRFVNTLVNRLFAFVDKRYAAIKGSSAIEQNYLFQYETSFEHFDEFNAKNAAKISVKIDLSAPFDSSLSQGEEAIFKRYQENLRRAERIYSAVLSYMNSPFIKAMGKNFIRPPVIRTNAILKNKNLKACLTLWEYIESCSKAGYSISKDEYTEMPSDSFITDLYSSVSWQYTDFYNTVVGDLHKKLLAEKHISETYPDFNEDYDFGEEDDYSIYDSEYKKLVPVSRLLNNRKKLSDDEKRIRVALIVALEADEELEARRRRAEEEERRRRAEERLLALENEDYNRECARLYAEATDEEEAAQAAVLREIMAEEAARAAEEARLAEEEAQSATARELTALMTTEAQLAAIAEEEEAQSRAAAENTDEDAERLLEELKAAEANAEDGMAAIVVGSDGERHIVYIRYRRSYISKCIQGDEDFQDCYHFIKNILLSYKKVKSRISWSKETFKQGKTMLAILNVKGKSLWLYLNLDPKEFEGTKYKFKDLSDKPKFAQTPLGLKLSSDRAQLHAAELISIMMDKLGIPEIPREAENLRFVYRNDEELIERGLIKTYFSGDVTPDTLITRANIDEMFKYLEGRVKRTPTEPQVEATEEAEIPSLPEATAEEEGKEETSSLLEPNAVPEAEVTVAPEGSEDAERLLEELKAAEANAEDGMAAIVTDAAGAKHVVYIRYRRSYISKCIQGDEDFQDCYHFIKNTLLSYKKVKSRMSWSKETFKQGKIQLAILLVKGKSLWLYLNLDPKDYEGSKYRFKDFSDKPKFAQTPLGMKLSSDRAQLHAYELIADMMAKHGIAEIPREAENLRFTYRNDAELIERGLIKTYYSGDVTPDTIVTQANIDEMFKYLEGLVGTKPDAPVEASSEEAKDEKAASLPEATTEAIEAAEAVSLPEAQAEVAEEAQEAATEATEEAIPEAEAEAESASLPEAQTEVVEEAMAEAESEITEAVGMSSDDGEATASTVTPDTVYVRYRRSYMANVIQADESLKDCYNFVKNELLSYKGVKARVSWSSETFKAARIQCGKLVVKGKNIWLYLNLDPKEYAESKFFIKDLSDKPKFAEMPLGIKLRSDRSQKHAAELIADMMAKLGLARIERDAENFRPIYEDNEALIEKNLIKVYYSGEVTEDSNLTTANIDEMLKFMESTSESESISKAPTEAAEAVSLPEAQTEVVEEAEEAATEATEEAIPEAEAESASLPEAQTEVAEEARAEAESETTEAVGMSSDDGEATAPTVTPDTVYVRYRRSYMANVIQADESLKDCYNFVKNELLSYKGVKARVSWSSETFKAARIQCGKLVVKGKNIWLYLNLDPKEYAESKFFIKDLSDKPKFAEMPLGIKLRSDRSQKHAAELIADMMAKLGLARIERDAENFRPIYEDNEALIEKNLIKVYYSGEVTEDSNLTTANIDEMLKFIEAEAEESEK